MDNPTTIERYRNLQRVMLTLPPEKVVDMSTFGDPSRSAKENEVVRCNTVACAIGFCGVDPWFNAIGLKLVALNLDTEHPFMMPVFDGYEGDPKVCASEPISRAFNDDEVNVDLIFALGGTRYASYPVTAEDVVLNAERRLRGLTLSDYDIDHTDEVDDASYAPITLRELREWGEDENVIAMVRKELNLPEPG